MKRLDMTNTLGDRDWSKVSIWYLDPVMGGSQVMGTSTSDDCYRHSSEYYDRKLDL
jgi:hypothetical protein